VPLSHVSSVAVTFPSNTLLLCDDNDDDGDGDGDGDGISRRVPARGMPFCNEPWIMDIHHTLLFCCARV